MSNIEYQGEDRDESYSNTDQLDSSVEMVIESLKAQTSEKKAKYQQEKNIIQYLRSIGLEMKTDPSKKRKLKSNVIKLVQTIGKVNNEIVSRPTQNQDFLHNKISPFRQQLLRKGISLG